MDYLPFLPKDDVPAPDPRRKEAAVRACQAYMSTHVPAQSSTAALLRIQLTYLSPWVWLSQVLVLLGAALAAVCFPGGPIQAGDVMLRLAPAFCLFSAPELLRSPLHRMCELEASCKYPAGAVLLARAVVTGCISLLALTLSAGALAAGFRESLWKLLLYGLVPFNTMNLLSLAFVRLLRICGALAGHGLLLLSALAVAVTDLPSALLHLDLGLWTAVLAVTTVCLALQLRGTLKHMEGILQWN